MCLPRKDRKMTREGAIRVLILFVLHLKFATAMKTMIVWVLCVSCLKARQTNRIEREHIIFNNGHSLILHDIFHVELLAVEGLGSI